MEHEEQSEKLSRELDRLDEHSEEVGEQIDEARRDWEAKEDDPAVPGAQPEPGGSSVTETPEQSDQLPEEGPAEQVHDDGGDAGADESAGTPGDEGTATGNPDAAGADDEEDQAGA
jgi:hypothetical protein